jgi:hypothetical protein
VAGHYPPNLALISLKIGGCLVGLVRSRTQATEFLKIKYHLNKNNTFANPYGVFF